MDFGKRWETRKNGAPFPDLLSGNGACSHSAALPDMSRDSSRLELVTHPEFDRWAKAELGFYVPFGPIFLKLVG